MQKEQLADAAAEAVARGTAQAVILFGSRARGTARPNSDWDVCLIAEDTNKERAKALARQDPIWTGERIETLWTTHKGLIENAHKGTVYADIVREGQLLYGDATMLRNIEIKPFKAEYVMRDITRASRHLENAGSAVIRRENETDELLREDLTEVASLESISAAEAIGRAMCSLADVEHSGNHDLKTNGERILGKADRIQEKLDQETLRQMGTLLKMMNGGIKEPRGAPYHNVVEPEGTWTRRLVLALRAEEALRSGLVEGSGPFERLARHERAEELAPRLRRSTAGKAREIQALARNLPTKLNNQIRTEITKWSNTYTRIAQETPNTTPGKKRDEEGLNPRMRG